MPNDRNLEWGSVRARLRNTISDCEWYFARLAWMYYGNQFGSGPVRDRFLLIKNFLTRRFADGGDWPKELKLVYNMRELCQRMLEPGYSDIPFIKGSLTSMFDTLHSFDTKLSDYDTSIRTVSEQFAYPHL